jgi:hypothetical protein
MFDRTIISPRVVEHVTEHVTEHVHEHRAPTDASVKLLREMEDAARNSIANSVRVTNTEVGFDAVIHKRYDIVNDQTEYTVVFMLLGQREVVFHHESAHRPAPGALAMELVEKVGKRIAAKMLSRAFHNVRV